MSKILKTACVLLAALTVITCSLTLFGCDSSDAPDVDYAKSKVEDYASWQAKYNAEFYDEVYAKAYMAAISFTPKKTDEELQSIARYLFVDSITVTDADGKVIAEYPKTNIGKNIGDIDGMVKFKSILKWVCPKCDTGIVRDKDSGEYSMSLGVQRVDDGGCVIVSLKTDAYAKVDGSDLAEKCGPNVIVAKDKTIISSTMKGADVGKKLSDLDISDDDIKSDSFDLTAGKESCTCKAATVDIYTVIVGE